VCLKASNKLRVHNLIHEFLIYMAFTMACPNYKKGLKMAFGPLGVNKKNYHITLFPLKVLVPYEKCSWFKIVIMIFWKGWRSPIPLKPKIHYFLVGRTASYSFYFLLNLQLNWNFLLLMNMWKSQVLMLAWALLTEAVLYYKK
jgi:hypothetical protein